MINLIEMQDALKNASDQQLLSQMQEPGQAPTYLVLGEIKRRADMRKRAGHNGAYPLGTLAQQYPMEMFGMQPPGQHGPQMSPSAGGPPMGGMPMEQPGAAMYPMQMAPPQPDPMMRPQPAGIAGIGQHTMPARGFAGGGQVGFAERFPDYLGATESSSNNRTGPPSYTFDWFTDWLESSPGSARFRDTYAARRKLRHLGINPEGSDAPDLLRRINIDPDDGFPYGEPKIMAADPKLRAPAPPSGTDPYDAVDLPRRQPAAPSQNAAPQLAPGGVGVPAAAPQQSLADYLQQVQGLGGGGGYADVLRRLQELQPDPEQVKQDAISNALMTAGFGIMGARGNIWNAIGQGGLAGLQAYNSGRGQLREQQIQNLGIEAKIAQAQDAASRGDRELAARLMSEANTMDFRNRQLRQQAVMANRGAESAMARLKIADMNRRVKMFQTIQGTIQATMKAEMEAGTWPTDRAEAAKRKAQIAREAAMIYSMMGDDFDVVDSLPSGAGVLSLED